MSSWKAGPERPRTPFCWHCSARLYGRVHARIKTADGAEHDVHKQCVDAIEVDFEVIGGSTTQTRDERRAERDRCFSVLLETARKTRRP